MSFEMENSEGRALFHLAETSAPLRSSLDPFTLGCGLRLEHADALARSQDSYIQSRSTAIESIESTIAELGQIFSQLAGMVAEQRETVQRIDADVTDISAWVLSPSLHPLPSFP